MSIIFNNTKIDKFVFNGVELDKAYMNGTEVFSAYPYKWMPDHIDFENVHYPSGIRLETVPGRPDALRAVLINSSTLICDPSYYFWYDPDTQEFKGSAQEQGNDVLLASQRDISKYGSYYYYFIIFRNPNNHLQIAPCYFTTDDYNDTIWCNTSNLDYIQSWLTYNPSSNNFSGEGSDGFIYLKPYGNGFYIQLDSDISPTINMVFN